MLIVGELINASRKSVGQAIQDQDAESIKQLARDQAEHGANYIDLNAGVFFEEEAQYLKWLVEQVQETVDVPLCLDSPDPAVLEAALAVCKDSPMINSVSLEKDRFERALSLVKGTDLKVCQI